MTEEVEYDINAITQTFKCKNVETISSLFIGNKGISSFGQKIKDDILVIVIASKS
jgi:hypothetical protein